MIPYLYLQSFLPEVWRKSNDNRALDFEYNPLLLMGKEKFLSFPPAHHWK